MNGLYNSEELIDSLILDCNNAVRQMAAGQYVGFCGTIVQMVQKLTKLKDGIRADMKSKDDNIRELKAMNDRLQEENTGLPVTD